MTAGAKQNLEKAKESLKSGRKADKQAKRLPKKYRQKHVDKAALNLVRCNSVPAMALGQPSSGEKRKLRKPKQNGVDKLKTVC